MLSHEINAVLPPSALTLCRVNMIVDRFSLMNYEGFPIIEGFDVFRLECHSNVEITFIERRRYNVTCSEG